MENKRTGEMEHRCMYGLIELDPINWPTINAWRYIRVFGPEAGMNLLLAAIGTDAAAKIAEDLVLLQSDKNVRDQEKAKPKAKR